MTTHLTPYLPWLTAMAMLVGLSAFCSCSEAALFYLRRQDRRAFESGSTPQQIAARLLRNPDRLLTAVLFWNLVINISYFAMASIVSLQLERHGLRKEAGLVAGCSLLCIIFFSEMLPKTLAVMYSRSLSALVSVPLTAAVRLVDPLLPFFRTVHVISRRAIWPSFQSEPYLQLTDLQRAIQLSTTDKALLEHEEAVLRNIVGLSDIQADELMRPRPQCQSFPAPVNLADLAGNLPPSGYVLVTEDDDEEIVAAIPVCYLSDIPHQRLHRHAVPVIYVPWCATAASVLESMRRQDRKVAAVVNEFGETIGIITFDDVIASVFSQQTSRSDRLLRTAPVVALGPDRWQVNSMTSLRRFAKHVEVKLPESKSITVSGMLQEVLQRLPASGDTCRWGTFQWQVVEVAPHGHWTVTVQRLDPAVAEDEG